TEARGVCQCLTAGTAEGSVPTSNANADPPTPASTPADWCALPPAGACRHLSSRCKDETGIPPRLSPPPRIADHPMRENPVSPAPPAPDADPENAFPPAADRRRSSPDQGPDDRQPAEDGSNRRPRRPTDK